MKRSSGGREGKDLKERYIYEASPIERLQV